MIAAFGACVLGIALALHPVGDYYTESDFYGGYAIGARGIQHGIVDPSRYPVVGPGYEFVLALLGAFGIDLFLAGKLLSVACATATLALWSILLRRRAGAAVALAVTVLFAANPVFVRYAYSRRARRSWPACSPPSRRSRATTCSRWSPPRSSRSRGSSPRPSFCAAARSWPICLASGWSCCRGPHTHWRPERSRASTCSRTSVSI